MDELGLIVKYIDQDGFIRFHTLGGFDARTIIGQRVIIHGKQDIIGVIGIKPIHFMSEDERKRPIEIADLYIATTPSNSQAFTHINGLVLHSILTAGTIPIGPTMQLKQLNELKKRIHRLNIAIRQVIAQQAKVSEY